MSRRWTRGSSSDTASVRTEVSQPNVMSGPTGCSIERRSATAARLAGALDSLAYDNYNALMIEPSARATRRTVSDPFDGRSIPR